MREKFVVRPFLDEGDNLVAGISFLAKPKELTGRLLIGGPVKFMEFMADIAEHFGYDSLEKGERTFDGRRFRVVLGPLARKDWNRGVQALSKTFKLTPTRKFTRLMR